ncbi:UDP-N-acetylmuramoyl-L-alanine--D-glutamate ligase [Conexibacter sp. SYSU D00693]|uniref:UDP-N-acetylmuramoyl-L-alanine--D-glutamate ligase n=1 Tax=Conexibacter sp. SYSU D00693 TaxID=2812560 RepID=UPI00196AC849|nr:UDP-N-acetylmuramoyl-L-alanine--D-glutamate ligase [Conexibacter sp. SYSU D00693]
MTALVVGLARSGAAAARLLRSQGETVLATDRGTPEVDLGPDVELHLATDGVALLDRVDLVVKSPGVPREAPVVVEARRRGIPVLGELEVAWKALGRPVVAVTGTNGKTTTVELLGHVHRTAGIPVVVAGNVGTALSDVVGTLPEDGVAVVECSSFQLEDTVDFSPDAALCLNVQPDHLDRHGTFEDYRGAKARIFANQGPGDVAVVPRELVGMVGGRAQVVLWGEEAEDDLRLDEHGDLRWRGARLMGEDEVRLRGGHNLANAMAAAAVSLARGIELDAVREALRTFAGVPHRLEEVGRVDGVVYVNDSKATNVASTLVALQSFEEPVHLVLGGQGKAQDFGPLRAPTAGCASVHLIGEDAELIREAIGTGELRGDLEHAVAAARAAARPGEVVLLSPACASFDQFADFEARGDAFRAIVSGLS